VLLIASDTLQDVTVIAVRFISQMFGG